MNEASRMLSFFTLQFFKGVVDYVKDIRVGLTQMVGGVVGGWRQHGSASARAIASR